MIAAEVKFSGQTLLFGAVTATNTKHREYFRSKTNLTRIMRKFVEEIRQEAPAKLRSHVLFQQLYSSPESHLTAHSRSYCAKVTRHQPIIPYRHLQSSDF